MIKQWSPRASPLRLSELSPLASGGEDDFFSSGIAPRPECTVVLDPLPSDLLESLSSDGHVRMGLPTPPDSVRGDDAEQETVSELLRDMVDRLDTRSHRKKKRKSNKHRRRDQEERPRVSPIFVWVRQAEEGVIGEVWCEDYDKRNRLRLTKTPGGWRAIPRTQTLSELEATQEGTFKPRRDSRYSTSQSEGDELDDAPDTEELIENCEDDDEEGAEVDLGSKVEDKVVDSQIAEEKSLQQEEEQKEELKAVAVAEAVLDTTSDSIMDTVENVENKSDKEESAKKCLEKEAVPVFESEKEEAMQLVNIFLEQDVSDTPEELKRCSSRTKILPMALRIVKRETPDLELATPNPEEVADLSAKKKEPGPLPCRSPQLRLPPLPRKPLPSPVLQMPCEFRTPSPAHQAQPLALPGVPRTLQSPLPAHLHERPAKRPLETPEAPSKRQKPEPTLRELLREKKQESRLLQLLTSTPKRPQVPKSAPLDALAQLRLVMAQLRVPDPLLIPQSRLSALLASPATEIPRLLAMPPSPLSPDVIPVALDRLQALLQRPDTELLAWAAQDWALPGPQIPSWSQTNLAALHAAYAAMGPYCVPPPMETWRTPPPPRVQPPKAAAPVKNPPPPGPPKPRIVCKALSDLMPKKKAPKPSPQLVSPPPSITTSLQGATKGLPQLWHPLFGSHTSESWNWRKTVPVHGD